MFGRLISPRLAKDIFATFIQDGFVQVVNQVVLNNERISETSIDPLSEGVQCALTQAFETAAAHDCMGWNSEGNVPEKSSPLTDQGETFVFKWFSFSESLGEDEVVLFLNEVIDRAFVVAKIQLARKAELPHRFASPTDKFHAFPLGYAMDEEYMRPEFLLLPIQAFSGEGFKVDKRYFNFVELRFVGALCDENMDSGLERDAQVLGCLTRDEDIGVFLRGDWYCDSGRAAGFSNLFALADGVELVQNPDVEPGITTRAFPVVFIVQTTHPIPLTTDSPRQ